MKQFFLKTTFAVLSAIIVYGCSQEPYDLSEGKIVFDIEYQKATPKYKSCSINFALSHKGPLNTIDSIKITTYVYNESRKKYVKKRRDRALYVPSSEFETNYNYKLYTADIEGLTPFVNYIYTIDIWCNGIVECFKKFGYETYIDDQYSFKTQKPTYSIYKIEAKYVESRNADIYMRYYDQTFFISTVELGIIYSTKEEIGLELEPKLYNKIIGEFCVVNLENLEPNTTYYYKTYIKYDGEIFIGDEIYSFTTTAE